MKYIQFGIMAVLMFSLALSPAFSNGLAFANTEDGETRDSEKEQKESTAESTQECTEQCTEEHEKKVSDKEQQESTRTG